MELGETIRKANKEIAILGIKAIKIAPNLVLTLRKLKFGFSKNLFNFFYYIGKNKEINLSLFTDKNLFIDRIFQHELIFIDINDSKYLEVEKREKVIKVLGLFKTKSFN